MTAVNECWAWFQEREDDIGILVMRFDIGRKHLVFLFNKFDDNLQFMSS